MAWTAPRTWVLNDVLQAAQLNTHSAGTRLGPLAAVPSGNIRG